MNNSTFWITKDNWQKLQAYASIAYTEFKGEIGGQLVLIEKEGKYWLENPVILKQTISGTKCDLDAGELAIHYSKMASKYGDNVRHVWWHSHHTMEAFWSGTDTDTIEEGETKDFSVSLVINLKEEYKLRVQFFHPIKAHEDVTLNISGEEMDIPEEMIKEVKDKCEANTYVNTYNGKYKHTYYNYPAPTANRDQMNLLQNTYVGLANNDQEDDWIDEWPGFGVTHFEAKGINSNKASKDYDNCLEKIEKMQDEYFEGRLTFNQWEKLRAKLNKKYKRYNVHMPFIEKKELLSLCQHYEPFTFLEEIEKSTQGVY